MLNDKIQTIFFSCSKEQTLNKYYIDNEDNKLYNQYYDFSNVFNENNINENQNNIISSKENNKYMNYFTVIKFHPIQKNYLYLGDQKGCIYILDINKNNIIFKQYIGETYSIDSLSFNFQGNLLCVGFETGMETIYYINNLNTHQKFEKYILLNNHFFSPEEIEMRQINNHILTYSFFFNQSKIYENKIIYMKSSNRIECSSIIEKNNNYKQIIYDININHKILDIKMHRGENYLIILDDNLQIIIYDLMFKDNVGIIDLSEQVKYAYNINIDISGLYLSLLCQLKDNNIEKSDIVLFETGTGNVHSFISGISPINKIKFDYNGKYLITAGINGEIFLLGLDENAINSIQNVIEEMNKNPKFLEQYEISFENKKEKNYLNHLKQNFNKIEKNNNQNISNAHDRNFSFRFNYNDNNSSLKNNINPKKFRTENNIFSNFSNRKYRPKTPNYKTFPNIGKLSTLIPSHNSIYNNLNTSNTNNSNNNKSSYVFNYSVSNKYNNVPKLSYINIVNDKFNTFQNKNQNGLSISEKIKLNSHAKAKKEIQIKNINKAISELMNDENKKEEENINSKMINKFSFSNNILNNNLSSFYSYDSNLKNKFNSNYGLNESINISKDFMIINNKRINQTKTLAKTDNNSINTTFLIYHKDNHKKYPEPKDIDDIENFYYINNNISNFLNKNN